MSFHLLSKAKRQKKPAVLFRNSVLLAMLVGLVWVNGHMKLAEPAKVNDSNSNSNNNNDDDNNNNRKEKNAAKLASCGCPTLVFENRSKEMSAELFSRWEQARDFVAAKQLSFLPEIVQKFHRDKIHEIETNGIAGSIFECGVAKAGSSILFTAMKNPNRCLHLFDTFEGIPPPSERDGKDVHNRYAAIQRSKQMCRDIGEKCDKTYYGNMDNLLAYDQKMFDEAGYPPVLHHVSFHKGLFDDTVWPDGPIALAHLDGDWYDSTMNMLVRISPHLSSGGYFILDDVFSWSGARRAFADFFDVSVAWLRRQKSCLTSRNGTHFRVFAEARAGAQLLPAPQSSQDEVSLVPCQSK